MARSRRLLPGIVAWLDAFFAIDEFEQDPAFSRYLPIVYDAIGFDWRSYFLPAFASRMPDHRRSDRPGG